MPELPDVEGFKEYFKDTSLNKKITEIECQAKGLIKGITFQRFKARLIGRRFRDAWRRGKFLIIELGGIPERLIIHFGMTGNFHNARQGATRNGKDRFTRLVFRFENGYELRWLNMRKLGGVYLVKDPQDIGLIREMGPEPLELAKPDFLELLEKHRTKNVKAFFLDQRDIAGVGNIYSDEILFRARISPHRKINTLSPAEKEGLYRVMRRVLRDAIKVRPPSGRFGWHWLLFHRGRDMRCPRDKTHSLKREIIAGRATVFCPGCQR